MTRWARGAAANKKAANDATPWTEMVAGVSGGQVTKPKKLKKKKKLPTADGDQKSHTLKTQSPKKKKAHKKPFNPAALEKGARDTTPLFTKRFGHGFGAGTDVLPEPPKKTEPTGVAAQLEQLKSSMQLDSDEEQEISEAIKKDKRRETRRLKRMNQRQMTKMCFNCRQPGHEVGDCPQVRKDRDQGTGICFKCGSTEHRVDRCRMKVPPGHYPYAKCFICGETGHLSKQCPDNPRGLYPKGGCCKQCSSVEHYAKDCPELQAQQGIRDMALPMIDSQGSVDDELAFESKKMTKRKTGPKVVKF